MKILIKDKAFNQPIRIKYYELSCLTRETIKEGSFSNFSKTNWKMSINLPRLNFEFPIEYFDTLTKLSYLNLELDSSPKFLLVEKIENNRIQGIVLENSPTISEKMNL